MLKRNARASNNKIKFIDITICTYVYRVCQ